MFVILFRSSIGNLHSIGHAGSSESPVAAIQKWLHRCDAGTILLPKTGIIAKRQVFARCMCL